MFFNSFLVVEEEEEGTSMKQSLSKECILLLYLNIWHVYGQSSPGKPKITSCLSQGNETFTCRWNPDSEGRLPTNYTLFYKTKGEEEPHECPDYLSAGPYSCHFNQSFTSHWRTYNITVKATNDAGSNISDPFYVDIKNLVKPKPPMNLSLEVKLLNDLMYVWTTWSPPPWVNEVASCNYVLRLKPVGGKEWESYFVGDHTQYKISKLHPAMNYTAQVRCITDYGIMTAWSPESFIHLQRAKPPEQPVFIGCRSPEKETFTCWWKPSSEGSLPVNYTLLYNKEGNKKQYECPDYTTAGPNSCYFDEQHTSIWTTYIFTLKATNEMGSSVSDTHYVDVANIVQPNPPENLSLEFEKKVYGKYVLLNWNPPSRGDVKSGWLTFEYELRIKPDEGQEWENIFVGQRTTYKMFSVNQGEKYVAQVRCRSDHGNWSAWTPESYIKLQKDIRLKDLLVWIFVAFLSFTISLILIWILALKKTNMVACLLPPVPGPKIKGLDTQLLEAGKTEELLSALDFQGFPPTSDYDDMLVEFLEIDDGEDQQLMPSHGKSHPHKNVKAARHEADCDSGRGSCESPSLLPVKRGEEGKLPSKVEASSTDEEQRNTVEKKILETLNLDPERELLWSTRGSPRASTWPGSQPANTGSANCSSCNATEIRKMALQGIEVKRSPVLMRREKQHGAQPPEPLGTVRSEKTAQLESLVDLSVKVECSPEAFWFPPPERFFSAKPMDYVEIHKVSHDGALAVLPKQKESVGLARLKSQEPLDAKEYTKVSTIVSNHILVLLPDSKMEVLPSFQEPSAESGHCCQQGQTEKNMIYSLTTPSVCKIPFSGLDYMDPNNFIPA